MRCRSAETRYNAHVAVCDGIVHEYMTINEDPEVLPDASSVDPSVMNTLYGMSDQDMYYDDMIEYDFGDSLSALVQQPLYADNCGGDDDHMTDEDFATDDNYNDHSDNEDEVDQKNVPEQQHIVVGATDQVNSNEEGGIYIDPWDKEPPLHTDVPFEETDHNVSRDAYTSLLSMLNEWIVDDSFDKKLLFLPAKSEARLEKMFNLQETKYRICPGHCRLFPLTSMDNCSCGKEQFFSNGEPIASMSYFPLRRQLAYMISDQDIRMSILDTVTLQPLESGEEVLTDIMDGKWKLENDYRTSYIIESITKGKFSYTTSERAVCSEDAGINVYCEGGPIHVKVHLLLASGDLIGCQEIAHHTGNNSEYGCRQCHIKTTSEISPAGKGHGRYYPSIIAMSTPRANVTRKLWDMITGNFTTDVNSTIKLRRGPCLDIGRAIVDSGLTLPSRIFEGSFRDVSKKAGLMRSIDWIMFLQIMIPTLVFEQLVDEYGRNAEQVQTLMSLVIGCTLSLQWEIDREDHSNIKKHLNLWHLHMKNNMDHNLYMVNFHLLRHFTEIIKKLGPLRGYSTRSAERTIANAAKSIKRQLLMRNFERMYKSDDPIGELPVNQYVIPDEDEEYEEIIVWNHHIASVTDYNAKYNLIEYLTNYWHYQFRDDRVLHSVLDNNIHIGKQLLKGDIIFRCQEYPSTAKKLDTLVKLIMPTTSGSGMFFGDLLLFFTHTYEGIEHPLCLVKVYGNIRMTEYGTRGTKKGVPFGFRTSSNTSNSDKLYVTHANNIKTNAGLLKSSLHDG
ncbi:hypothetical protein INT45_000059 [Circinella minor]|uniref:Transposase domain-containing protein n=1 Tax=Circinella minor TaxID=1195481 RepID=A0A8H7VBU0_9FUNG|nr:hypothetical protein INT45_000059 [Circinella minor]